MMRNEVVGREKMDKRDGNSKSIAHENFSHVIRGNDAGYIPLS